MKHSSMPIAGRLTDSEKEKLEKVRQKILADITVHYTIGWLSTFSGLNELNLKQGFKKQYGTTVYDYLEDHRLQLGMHLVTNTYEPYQAIALKCGYTLQTNFAAAFRRKFGCTPDKYRRQAGLAFQQSEEKSTAMTEKAVRIINASLHNHHTSQTLAKIMGVDHNRLCAEFKSKFGMGVYRYLRLQRMERAKELTTKGQTAEVIYSQIGYKNVNNLYMAFKLTYKKTYGAWKEEVAQAEREKNSGYDQIDHTIQYDSLLP